MPIKIRDNGEPLVDIKKYCPGVAVEFDGQRMIIEKTAYLRKGVAKMLTEAQGYLPKGINFVVRDAWRPAYIQAEIYFDFIKRFSKKHPTWTRRRVIEETEKYVAFWKGKVVSGHMTGGAVDVRLINSSGHKMPMRSRKLSYQENALAEQKKLPAYLQKNRQILFSAMQRAGFSNYPKEFWHWSYGDYYWAKRNKKPFAIYGPVDDINDLYSDHDCPCSSGKKFKRCCGRIKYFKI